MHNNRTTKRWWICGIWYVQGHLIRVSTWALDQRHTSTMLQWTLYRGVSTNGDTPKWMVMEKPIKIDGFWGYPHDQTETSIRLFMVSSRWNPWFPALKMMTLLVFLMKIMISNRPQGDFRDTYPYLSSCTVMRKRKVVIIALKLHVETKKGRVQ